MKANTSLPISFTTLAILLALICVTHQAANWPEWNNKAFTNSSFGTNDLPPVPANTVRADYFGNPPKYQYAYIISAGANQCKVFCGPRSFLKVNTSSNTIYC